MNFDPPCHARASCENCTNTLLSLGLIGAPQWYFCSTRATGNHDGDLMCYELPMQASGRNVYICSTPRGQRPGYYE